MKCNISTNNRLNRRRLQAFTLVELLLVLTILAILAAIVLPRLAGQGERARVGATKTQINAFSTALDMFEVDNGHYPRGKNGLNDLVVQPKDASSSWHQYLDSIPLDPWQHPYIYDAPGKHRPTSYDISSMGPDGQAGTPDDINNWDAAK